MRLPTLAILPRVRPRATLVLLALSLSAPSLLRPLRAQDGFTESDLPLPAWSPDEWQRLAKESAPPLLGGLLPGLGEDAMLGAPPLESNLTPKYPDAPPPLFGAEPARSLRDGLALFLPEGINLSPALPEQTSPPPPTPTVRLRDVTPEFLETLQLWPDNDPLMDPGAELAETPSDDLRRFLGYHAEKAAIPIIVLLLARDETLPSTADLSLFAQGSLSKRRAALLVYPFGEPWRARLFLPAAAHQAVSDVFLTRLVEACLSASSNASLPEDQLHEYVVQLSIRLFWLQKELAKSQTASQAFADSSPATPLTEVGPQNASAAPALSTPTSASTFALPQASLIIITTLSILLLGILAHRLARSWRTATSKKRLLQSWTLPEGDTQPRLGGSFCGGSGAWGSWK